MRRAETRESLFRLLGMPPPIAEPAVLRNLCEALTLVTAASTCQSPIASCLQNPLAVKPSPAHDREYRALATRSLRLLSPVSIRPKPRLSSRWRKGVQKRSPLLPTPRVKRVRVTGPLLPTPPVRLRTLSIAKAVTPAAMQEMIVASSDTPRDLC